MKANWIKQTTATTGTGLITLGAALAGFTAISDHSTLLPDGCQVRYQIIDGNNREEGIGTYTAAGTTLSRDTIIETLVAGVYDNTSPAALTLSGSATVAIGVSASNAFDGQGGNHSADYICYPDNVSRTDQQRHYGPVANRIEYLAAYLLFPRLIPKLAFGVYTADVASVDTRCGIWSVGADGGLGRLIYGSNHMSAASAGVVTETLASPLYLPAGLYWWGFKSDSIVAEFTAIEHGTGQVWGSPLGIIHGAEAPRFPYTDGVVGAMPSAPTMTGISSHPNLNTFGWQSQ